MMMALAATVMFSCKQSTNPDDQGGSDGKQSYINLKVSRSAATKADVDNGDGTLVGTDDENAIHNITVYFFKPHATNEYQGTYVFHDTYPITNNSTGTVPIGIALGTYNIYVVANGKAKGVTLSTTTTEQHFLENAVYTVEDAKYTPMSNVVPEIEGSTTQKGFIMVSRLANGETDNALSKTSPYAKITILATNNTTTNPAKPKNKIGGDLNSGIDMERVVGRLELAAANKGTGTDINEYEVTDKSDGTGTKIATVEIKEYQVVNQHKPFNIFRHVSVAVPSTVYTYGDASFGNINRFVNDPKTNVKVASYFATNGYGDAKPLPTDGTWWYDNPINILPNTVSSSTEYKTMVTNTSFSVDGTSEACIGYVNENTMGLKDLNSKDLQLRGFTTAIIFKASIKPVKVEEGGTYTTGDLWFYGNKFYSTLAELNKVGPWSFTAASTIADFATVGVKYYKSGECYYKHFIRHLDNDDPEVMGTMEFAIVRNNTYQMKVTAIKSMGDPGDGEDPDDPDEKSNLYIEVLLNVLPWQVRSNNIEF
ncbi:hypothetical protein BN938_1154 [Mucinivorans hirudinis]|uniref:Fimbrial subunit protein C-terminal domain-containing protein n=1 Tax=Mucinivorans hirudinis TaxID=1433126 RepID=A0A060RCT9_9BACT|nr:hypothetical protein BN938_1154 [Mucinivorans hirudinis]